MLDTPSRAPTPKVTPSPGIAPGLSHGGEEKGQPFSCRVTYSTPGSGWRQQQPRGWGRKGWREASGAAGGGTWGARGAGLTGAVPSAPARRGGKAASANLHHGLAFDAQSILTLLFPPTHPLFLPCFRTRGVFSSVSMGLGQPRPHTFCSEPNQGFPAPFSYFWVTALRCVGTLRGSRGGWPRLGAHLRPLGVLGFFWGSGTQQHPRGSAPGNNSSPPCVFPEQDPLWVVSSTPFPCCQGRSWSSARWDGGFGGDMGRGEGTRRGRGPVWEGEGEARSPALSLDSRVPLVLLPLPTPVRTPELRRTPKEVLGATACAVSERRVEPC